MRNFRLRQREPLKSSSWLTLISLPLRKLLSLWPLDLSLFSWNRRLRHNQHAVCKQLT